jgi:6-phosphogluconate dehydrogenase
MKDRGLAFGVIGLGNIGGNLVAQALEKGLRVVGYDKREPPQPLIAAGMERIARVEGLHDHLARPRTVFLYLPARPIVDAVLEDLTSYLEPDDLVVDGGNSY